MPGGLQELRSMYVRVRKYAFVLAGDARGTSLLRINEVSSGKELHELKFYPANWGLGGGNAKGWDGMAFEEEILWFQPQPGQDELTL